MNNNSDSLLVKNSFIKPLVQPIGKLLDRSLGDAFREPLRWSLYKLLETALEESLKRSLQLTFRWPLYQSFVMSFREPIRQSLQDSFDQLRKERFLS